MTRQDIQITLIWKTKKGDKEIRKEMRRALAETIGTFTGIESYELQDVKLTKIDLAH